MDKTTECLFCGKLGDGLVAISYAGKTPASAGRRFRCEDRTACDARCAANVFKAKVGAL